MSEEQRSRIPENANLIVVESSMAADSLYAAGKQAVLSSECETEEASDPIRDFDSKTCSPGQSHVDLRVSLTVDETDNGSRLEAKALLLSREGQRWQPATHGSNLGETLAFEEVVLLLDDLPGTMSFESEEGTL
jgi:hypothetical protein